MKDKRCCFVLKNLIMKLEIIGNLNIEFECPRNLAVDDI